MKKCIVICVAMFLTGIAQTARASISSVTLTAAPATTLSNGRSYYCAGVPYTFRIQAVDTAATGKAYWSNAANTINVTFPGGSSFFVNLNSPGPDTFGGTQMIVDTVTDNSGGVYTSIDYTIVVRFLWSSTSVIAGANSVAATVRNSTVPPDLPVTSTRSFNFGIISQISVLNFAQTGDAADARINPWHDGFNVTGRVVYYTTGATITTLVPAGEITAVNLYHQIGAAPRVATGVANTGSATNDFLYAIVNEYFAFGLPAPPLGTYTWSIDAVMATGGTAVTSVTPAALTVNVDRIQVNLNGLTFLNGGGRSTPGDAYNVRSVNVSGTQIQLVASMQNSGSAMMGTVTCEIVVNYPAPTFTTHTYTLQINNGVTTGTALITPYPVAADVTAGSNVEAAYSVTRVYGGSYGNTNPLNGQNVSGRIANSTGYLCRWENAHPPGQPAPSFTPVGPTPSTSNAYSFTLQWVALSTAAPYYDLDFYTYRIYYKKSSDGVSAYRMFDIVTDPVLGTRDQNPLTTHINTFTVGTSANPLEPLTSYDYRISAIDVFNNEVDCAPCVPAPMNYGNQIFNTVTTAPLTVEATVTDGITSYNNKALGGTGPAITNPNPVTHALRKTAVKIDLKVFTAGTSPDGVAVIVANNASDCNVAQWGTVACPAVSDDILLLPSDQQWTLNANWVSPNTYTCYIPSEHPLLAMGTNIRFIVGITQKGTTTYNDRDTPNSPTASHSVYEWRFSINKQAQLIPWPTRILNNVLTSALPCAYPAFFLVADALVTIKVYDVKGRVIAILCDKLPRPGGQNIKDMGWCGYNKDNRRVGPGLYHIHIKAVTYGGKTILDEIKKVVVRH